MRNLCKEYEEHARNWNKGDWVENVLTNEMGERGRDMMFLHKLFR